MKEGRCEGPKIAGDILPGGGDWILLGTDQVARLDVRATLRTDDGAHVHLTNTGRERMSPMSPSDSRQANSSATTRCTRAPAHCSDR